MNNESKSERVLARQFARELSLDELTQVGGQRKQACDSGDWTGSTCTITDEVIRCDTDIMNNE